MGTWLTVGWLRSLSEGNAVEDEAQPLYDAVLDALAAEGYRGPWNYNGRASNMRHGRMSSIGRHASPSAA